MLAPTRQLRRFQLCCSRWFCDALAHLSLLLLRSCLWCLSLDLDRDRRECLLRLLSLSLDLDLDLRGMVTSGQTQRSRSGVNAALRVDDAAKTLKHCYCGDKLQSTPGGGKEGKGACAAQKAMSRNWKFCPYSGALLDMEPAKGSATCSVSGYTKNLSGTYGDPASAVTWVTAPHVSESCRA